MAVGKEMHGTINVYLPHVLFDDELFLWYGWLTIIRAIGPLSETLTTANLRHAARRV